MHERERVGRKRDVLVNIRWEWRWSISVVLMSLGRVIAGAQHNCKFDIWTLEPFLMPSTFLHRILYMDSDMLITRPLDDVWEEETVSIPQKTKNRSLDKSSFNLPADYVITGVTDNERPDRSRPTPVNPHSRLNAGFLVFKPDIDLFEYYISISENQSLSSMSLSWKWA